MSSICLHVFLDLFFILFDILFSVFQTLFFAHKYIVKCMKRRKVVQTFSIVNTVFIDINEIGFELRKVPHLYSKITFSINFQENKTRSAFFIPVFPLY